MSCSVNRASLGSVALRMEGFAVIDFRENRKENRGRDNMSTFEEYWVYPKSEKCPCTVGRG
jgi:hypothetical protein